MPTRAPGARRGIGWCCFFKRKRRAFLAAHGVCFLRRYAALVLFRRYAALADGMASTA
jgi:hypothetical protein